LAVEGHTSTIDIKSSENLADGFVQSEDYLHHTMALASKPGEQTGSSNLHVSVGPFWRYKSDGMFGSQSHANAMS
jgi:hypothetical protein